ncbi:MAG: PCRF domain-containing protein, partial [Enterobacteriaceae bacterium]|nr:PCRF domain-containing protein [Enterobacteriaceae bacterium]
MNKFLIDQLNFYLIEYNKLKVSLEDPTIISNRSQFISISKDFSKIKDIANIYLDYKDIDEEIFDLKVLLNDCDSNMEVLILDEIKVLLDKKLNLEDYFSSFFSSNSDDEKKSVFVELRAASGGDEAAIFVGDLLKMYIAYFESKDWKSEMISFTVGHHGGYKDIVLRLNGKNFYSKIKYESGIH